MSLIFDPTSELFGDNRIEVYRRLRDEHPVFYDADQRRWVLSRFADVYKAAGDPVTFSSAASGEGVLLPMLNFLDAPRHVELRRLVSRAFTPRRIATLESTIATTVSDFLDKYIETGAGDLISGFAGPMVSTVVGRLIGIPESQIDEFRHLTDQLMYVGQRGGVAALQEVAQQIYRAFDQVLRQREQDPQDDLVSALLEVEKEGDLSDIELLGFCFLLVAGGNDTTTNLIANGWVMLLDHPDAMAALQADRSLLPGAIDEMLRLAPPAESHARVTTKDVVLHGVTIPEGARVHVLWGAANLDEREFPDPLRFDINRRPNRHLAFGHGAHFCLGAPLARLEARLAFGALLDRCGDLKLDPRPVRLPSPWACAYQEVQLNAAS